nr:hypothetical protein [Sphingobium sp.]
MDQSPNQRQGDRYIEVEATAFRPFPCVGAWGQPFRQGQWSKPPPPHHHAQSLVVARQVEGEAQRAEPFDKPSIALAELASEAPSAEIACLGLSAVGLSRPEPGSWICLSPYSRSAERGIEKHAENSRAVIVAALTVFIRSPAPESLAPAQAA